MDSGYTKRDMILNLIKGDCGRSGGKCVTSAIGNVQKEDRIYKETERLTFCECSMGSGYKICTYLNLDKNIRKHIGIVSEQIVRLLFSEKLTEKEKYRVCFLRQLRSAYAVNELDKAIELCEKITGNDNTSIFNMLVLSRFSDAELEKNANNDSGKYKLSTDLQRMVYEELGKVASKPLIYRKEITEIISLCINRLTTYFKTECKTREFGVILEISGTKVRGGEVDLVTRDSIVDIKVKEKFEVTDIIQVLTYARIMKLNKHKLYKGIKYVKLVNPFTNKVRTYTIKNIPKIIWELIDNDIINTYKQLSLFDEQFNCNTDINKLFE